MAVKIVKSANNYTDAALDEISLLKETTKHAVHPFHQYIVAFYDSFRLRGRVFVLRAPVQ